MTTALDVPSGLVITIHHGPGSCTLTPVAGYLRTPAIVRAVYDGTVYWERDSPAPMIWFSVPWHACFAGWEYGDISRMATVLASHITSATGDWPGAVAHVVSLPVVDVRFGFEVTAVPRSQASFMPPPVPAGLAEAIQASTAGDRGLMPAREAVPGIGVGPCGECGGSYQVVFAPAWQLLLCVDCRDKMADAELKLRPGSAA